jgi:plasmid maintenance system antidote protein VapI
MLPQMTISDDLRDAIRDSGKSVTALAKECGVPQPMLTRFVNGKDVRLETANKLAAYFGLTLQPEGKPVKNRK